MLKHARNLFLGLFQIERAHLVQWAMDWGHLILQIDFEFMPLAHWRKSKWEVLRKDIIKFLKKHMDR